MDDLVVVLNLIREHYMAAYMEAICEFSQEIPPSVPEVLFEFGAERAYAFRLYRIDLVSNINGKAKMREINRETYLSFAEKTFMPVPGLKLSLSPIAWNGVEITSNVNPSWKKLEEWTLRWIDVKDLHTQDKVGLQGVIHSVTAPEMSEGYSTFSVDFGSAPVAAIESLLQLLADLGATEVQMRSSWVK
ncbi:hypothetical protein HSX11_28415 [Oxalobacteraceae bacterium]|nr:hypothetical protein [Oxalobacteraceae bacterium]